MRELLSGLWTGTPPALSSADEVDAVGHRVVHGGADLTVPTLIDGGVRGRIRALAELAPTHNPANLVGIDLAAELFPVARQVAVFDTGFHATLPPAAFTFAGPSAWLDSGIRRYGFHGTSHHYVAHRTAALCGVAVDRLRIVTCHLGNGCSLAAVDRGRSVDTTMGLTPLDGLVMGTRSGSLDPGVLLHLLRTGATVEDLDTLLNKHSGLLGLSGVSNDMRAVRAAANDGNPEARVAIDVFVHRLRGQVAAMAAAMGGLDVLVFTGGIGEHDAAIRTATADGLAFLGVRLDATRNLAASGDTDIGGDGSAVRMFVVTTREDWAVACATVRLLG